MEVRSRQEDAKSACIKRRHGVMSVSEVLEEELRLLPEGCRIDWSAWPRARRKRRRGELSLVAAALSKIDAEWLCSYGRLA